MTKLTKEQTKRFNILYKEVINWGEYEPCFGAFREFGDNLDQLVTSIDGKQLELLVQRDYIDYFGYIPIDSKTKGKFKKLVEFLIDNPVSAIPLTDDRIPNL